MIIYIHGFGSHGNGSKAKQFREYFKSIDENFIAPSLSYVPELAIATLKELIASYHGEVYLIGSSLGGFYATYLSQLPEVKKVVLINPATKPMQTLSRALGDAPNFYDRSTFSWTQKYLDMLKQYEYSFRERAWEVENFFVLLQKGDETLNYKDAEGKYKGAKLVVEEGGNHSFEGVQRYFEEIRSFFEVGDHFKHTTKVKGVGFELDELAKRTGNLYYDDLALFVEELAKKIDSDAKADKERGRVKLAKDLENAASFLEKSSKEIMKAWDKCKIPTLQWMLENGFNKHDSKAEVLEEQIAKEFANRSRWDNVSMSDEKTRHKLANYDDDFTQEMIGVFEQKAQAYIEYLKTYLRVIASDDFYPEDVPNEKEFIEQKCKEFGFEEGFQSYYKR